MTPSRVFSWSPASSLDTDKIIHYVSLDTQISNMLKLIVDHLIESLNLSIMKIGSLSLHTHIFPRGVVHRVENGWGLTKVAVVLLNGLIW